MFESLFSPEGTIDISKLEGMSEDDLMKLLATQKASVSQGKQNPFAMYQQAMAAQPKMQGQAPAPQVRRGQMPNIMSPYEELMKMQQIQQLLRQRPQSLI